MTKYEEKRDNILAEYNLGPRLFKIWRVTDKDVLLTDERSMKAKAAINALVAEEVRRAKLNGAMRGYACETDKEFTSLIKEFTPNGN
jgi:hypothetical protein